MTKIARNIVYFNPRSPCGERRPRYDNSSSFVGFQSTLPVWGATGDDERERGRDEFQSTLPVWGATLQSDEVPCRVRISIHAPRVGSDLSS